MTSEKKRHATDFVGHTVTWDPYLDPYCHIMIQIMLYIDFGDKWPATILKRVFFFSPAIEEDSDRCGILPNFAEAKTMAVGVTSRERKG